MDGRRDFLKLVGVGGVVFASGLIGCSSGAMPVAAAPKGGAARDEDFFFLQLSDTHWGFEGAPNPEAATTLKTTIATINRVEDKPDFIVFTGDLTHTIDDGDVRRARMREFKEIVAALNVKRLLFLPGEHDAAPDRGAAYKEYFGDLHYSFDHKGIHFVALDNVSDHSGSVGDEQIAWLKADLARYPTTQPIVVFGHRPLFDLFPEWEWATQDGATVVDVLMPYANVTVFYGHIHQENHHMTGHIAHHSARSLIFPLPPPGSQPKRLPVPWDPAHPGAGLGYRRVETSPSNVEIVERPTR
jgi:hypothetical protein